MHTDKTYHVKHVLCLLDRVKALTYYSQYCAVDPKAYNRDKKIRAALRLGGQEYTRVQVDWSNPHFADAAHALGYRRNR